MTREERLQSVIAEAMLLLEGKLPKEHTWWVRAAAAIGVPIRWADV